MKHPAQSSPPLPSDQARWLEVARSVLAGDYDGIKAGASERGAVEIGLRAVKHPECVRALARFERLDARMVQPVKARKGKEQP